MLRKLFGIIMVVIAIASAVLGITLAREHLQWIMLVTNFFEMMVPALVVAALINYLWKSNNCDDCNCK
ncbi:MAG: hypothetical protein ABIH77_05490 [Pseudomonadota bacterium]|nr:hypothetical protein [Gammaproteobacteria bacterium]MBU1558282.1 hypothetical protein [Gammaproteobacteria bacterium]MBU1628814.1 hypothetical protein [Gammaproteobacteria bacterium]MBU1926613.1 hypothetical protein [Gammaproteobacteria bacterium]MBU2545839.1 hypothetical protein [Gammaproteobacteria bacterium]